MVLSLLLIVSKVSASRLKQSSDKPAKKRLSLLSSLTRLTEPSWSSSMMVKPCTKTLSESLIWSMLSSLPINLKIWVICLSTLKRVQWPLVLVKIAGPSL